MLKFRLKGKGMFALYILGALMIGWGIYSNNLLAFSPSTLDPSNPSTPSVPKERLCIPHLDSTATLNISALTVDYKIVTANLFRDMQPSVDELRYLNALNAGRDKTVLCQIGFNPYIALAQFRMNNNASNKHFIGCVELIFDSLKSVVYSFHPFDEKDAQELAESIHRNVTSKFIHIIGKPMHTVRAFAREFSYGGAATGVQDYSWMESYTSLPDSKRITDLQFDMSVGTACDIIYFSSGLFEEVLVMALLAHENTSILMRNENNSISDKWTEALNNMTISSTCSKTENSVLYGKYSTVYAMNPNQTKQNGSAYDILDLVDELRASFKNSLEALNGTKTVVWIPVGKAHKKFADILYCSLRKHNVTNYMYFAHDAEMYSYLQSNGRNVYFNDLWFTPIHGRQLYQSFNYNVVMRERFAILQDLFHLGYDVLLNDADIFWVINVLPDLESTADIVAQQDSFGPSKPSFAEVCNGFVLYKDRPVVRSMVNKMQQLAFLFPKLDDQQLSNIVYKSNLSCLVFANTTIAKSCHDEPITIQYKSPVEYVSGHFYCHDHLKWAEFNVPPKLIHLNGINKDECSAKSNGWGYPMASDCR